MKSNLKLSINVFVNILLLILIITMTYSWMLTQKSESEILDYNRDFVITASDIDVDVYALIGSTYTLQTGSPIDLGLLEPGLEYKYRLDITNTNDVKAVVRALYTNITGDISALESYIILGSTSPLSFAKMLDDEIAYNAVDDVYYAVLMDRVEIPANSTLSLYVYIGMSEDATNIVAGKELVIGNILFMKP